MSQRARRDAQRPIRLLAILDAANESFGIVVAGGASARPVAVTVVDGPEAAARTLVSSCFDVVVCRAADAARTVRAIAGDLPVIVLLRPPSHGGLIEVSRADVDEVVVESAAAGTSKLPIEIVERAIAQAAVRSREQNLMRALAQINQTVYVTDLDGRFLYVNETFCHTYGYRAEEVVGRPAAMVWADIGRHDLPPNPAVPAAAEGERGECVHHSKGGRTFPVLIARSPIRDASGRAHAWVGAVYDIAERKAREEALRESEERYALASAGANDGLWDWDLRTDLAHFSTRWKLLLGFRDDELGNRLDAWLDLVHPDDRERLEASLDAHITGDSSHFECEHRVRSKDGSLRWMISRGLGVRDHHGTVYRIAGSMRDVTDRRQAAERLNRVALHDPLTELPNRALFMDRLSHAVRRGRRQGEGFGVIFLDLDEFKQINDQLGHAAGDQVLRAVGRRLATCLREGDTVARLGGDEFAILLESLEDAEHARRVANRAVQVLEKPIRTAGVDLFVEASIGIAIADPSGPRYDAPDDILRDADAAMYRAKARSGTHHVLFRSSMGRRPVRGLDLERELTAALARDELVLYYQPILDLERGRLYGFEALLRWSHPERGLLLPSEFLPASADVGLAVPIGRWVLGRALGQIKQWRRESGEPLVMTVNLDDAMLASGELGTTVSQALAAAELPGHSLELDVSEAVLMLDGERAAAEFSDLGRAAVGFAIDDFGTSASSIGQLCRLPLDTLKIDRSLIGRIGIDERELVVVRAIVNLARQLGLAVTAEGVETLEQLALLRTLGCDRGQGHLFSRAVPESAVAQILAHGTAELPRLFVHAEGMIRLPPLSPEGSSGDQ